MNIEEEIKFIRHSFHQQTLRGKLMRFGVFISIYIIGRLLEIFIESSKLGHELLSDAYNLISSLILHISCLALTPFYPDIKASSANIIIIKNNSIIQMLPGCSGLFHIIRLTFVLLLYPISWVNKIKVYVPTIIIIIIAATVHFIILIPISYQFHEHYTFAHNYFAKSIYLVFIFGCWLFWDRYVIPSKY